MADPAVEEDALAVFDQPAYASPRVNLLPPEIGQRRALRKLQGGLAAGVVAAVAMVGLLYVQAGSGKSDAQARLDAANGRATTLTAQTAKLAYVSSEKALIDAARTSLKTALGGEVLWSKSLDNLRQRLPDGVRYASVTVTAVAAAATVGAAPAVVAPGAIVLPTNAIATATISGKAVDLDAVATELDQLALVPGVSNVYLTTTTQGGNGSTGGTAMFTATADITNAVLSHRYDNLTGVAQ